MSFAGMKICRSGVWPDDVNRDGSVTGRPLPGVNSPVTKSNWFPIIERKFGTVQGVGLGELAIRVRPRAVVMVVVGSAA